MMQFSILKTLIDALEIYSTLLCIRIVLTWFPRANYSQIGRFLSSICDPFLRLFSKISFLRIGNIDFSPILAFISISLASSVLRGIAVSGHFSILILVRTVLKGVFSIVDYILSFLLILLAIRLIFHLLRKGNYQLFDGIDTGIRKFGLKIYKHLSKKRFVQFRLLIVLNIVAVLLAKIALRLIFYNLILKI